ncbi:hypothetical protein ACFJIX_20695 [Roseateles sp. UC29_93]|uniref:hypothetical protein n=1 Tax=Roseateles sp. UC29_93 TaxID=3350177 RepID=UPI0036715618
MSSITSTRAPLIDPAGRPHIKCLKCRAVVVWPSDLREEDAALLGALAQRDRLEASKHAEMLLGLEPRAAKALALHLAVDNACHKCGRGVPKGVSLCECRSANINW